MACKGVAVFWICAGNRVDHTEIFSVIVEQGLYRAKAFSASKRDPLMSGSMGFGYCLDLNHDREVEYFSCFIIIHVFINILCPSSSLWQNPHWAITSNMGTDSAPLDL